MKDKTVLKISISAACIGILILLLVPIESFPPSNDFIKIKGEVKEVSDYGNTTKLSISHNQVTDIILFNNYNEFSKGEYVEISGKLSNDEVIADEVVLLEQS